MKKYHQVTDLHFENDVMILTVDGHGRRFQVGEVSPVLQKASQQEREVFEISPSGYGVHRPLLDEDISIDGLLGIVHTPERQRNSA
jgi:hypothetical protein